MKSWEKMSISDVALEFGTDLKIGRPEFSSEKKRRAANSIFLIPGADSYSIIKKMLSDISLLLLAACYILALFIGERSEAVFGIVTIFSAFVIGCSIKYRSSMRIANTYRIILPSSKIIEAGKKIRLSIFDVEVGDLIRFTKGDIIPADARLVSSDSLKVAERLFNKKSEQIEYVGASKNADPVIDHEPSLKNSPNMVYAGSMVMKGSGSAIVTAIGDDTRLLRMGEKISFIPENDMPKYFTKFIKECRITSLIILISLIPVTVLGICRSADQDQSLLYSFLLMLSLAVTSMSELVTLPAETLITKEIFSSSRKNKARIETRSKVTRFSSVEKLANVDVLLIMCQDVLIDKHVKVRRAYFAGKEFKFDSMDSSDLTTFKSHISPYFRYLKDTKITADERIIKCFLDLNSEPINKKNVPGYIAYPQNSAKVCVFDSDSEGRAVRFIAQTINIEITRECGCYRTEGGKLHSIDQKLRKEIEDWVGRCVASGQRIYAYISSNGTDAPTVLEGLLSIGQEFPYDHQNDDVEIMFSESKVRPVLIFASENEKNINTALQSGLLSEKNHVALASEYYSKGKCILDAPESTVSYIGFGDKGTKQLLDSLRSKNKNVLSIIKDSSHRSLIYPDDVYAVHDTESYDSVRVGASVNLINPDADSGEGGLLDALNIIKRSAMANLKIGIYRNYLFLSVFIRMLTVVLPIVFDITTISMTSVMILLSGFISDFLAIIAVMQCKGLPVSPQETARDTAILYSKQILILYAALAFIISGVSSFMTNEMYISGILTVSNAPIFLMISTMFSNMLSLGALLIILMKHSRKFSFNFAFVIEFLLLIVLAVFQSPACQWFENDKMPVVELKAIVFVLIPSIISFAGVLLVDKIYIPIANVFKRNKN